MGGGIDSPGAQRRPDHLSELAQPGRHPGHLVRRGCCSVVAARRALRSSLTSYRLSPPTLAWLRSAALRSAAARVAPLKSAPASLALLKFALLRSALLKLAPLRSAPARLTSPRLASLKSTPFSLIAVSGCSALHLFQVVATSCFNRST